jgi:hypothetical protein
LIAPYFKLNITFIHASVVSLFLAVLPMILVRNQIRNTFGGKTGKITFDGMWYKFGTSNNKNFALCAKLRGSWRVVGIRVVTVLFIRRGADCKTVGIRVVTVLFIRRDADFFCLPVCYPKI